MRSLRAAALLLLGLLAAGRVAADEIAAADLQIQGVGLKVVNVSVATGLNIPAAVQTEFGGRQNDQAPVVEGLRAVGELSGPGIDVPIRLETAPGHKFQIPGLQREGIYFLQNVRLMKGDDFLQPATPAVATITVSNLLQTSVKVRQLTAEEIRARGISVDPRNYDVYEYTFSFLVDGVTVEIPFPVIIDPRTHEVRQVPAVVPWGLPPVDKVTPPRWHPPDIMTFEMAPPPEAQPETRDDPVRRGTSGRISIPAAIVIPNNLAVLHQFFAVTLMVTNGAPDGSSVTLNDITAQIKPPAQLRTVKSIPSVAFNQPVPIVDAANGVRFLVAQARGEAEWTMEGLQTGTHTIEVEVKATYKSPGQVDFPLKGTARASVVVHDPRFNVNFSHPDVVRKDVEYSTYSFITNMSPALQNIRVTNALPACAESPGANVCRVDGTPAFHDLTIPAGEMRSIEYKLRPGITGNVFATAGSVNGDAITAQVGLHMGVSESGIPLSPATLLMPYYARFVGQPMVSSNLQLLGLGYSLATAPMSAALAKHPRIIKTDVFRRATDIARAGQRVFLGEPMRDALAHMSLDLLGNGIALREWDDLRRAEKSGRTGAAAIARELETATAGDSSVDAFVSGFATATAWRAPYLLAVTSAGKLSVRDAASNARMDVPSEAASGWVRQLPWGELDTFRGGELAIVGRWAGNYEVTVTPAADGPFTLDLILPAAAEGSVLRARFSATGQGGKALKVLVTKGATSLELRDSLGGIAATGTISSVLPAPLALVGARQDLHLDPGGHKVSILWNRPVSVTGDLLTKLAAQVVLNRDGVQYQGPRPISAAALQEGGRVANVTFDHALSKNATYTMTVGSLNDPIGGAPVTFPNAIVPVIDNDAPGGIIFGHVLKGDNSPIGDAEVRLLLEGDAGPPQYDSSRGSDGAFLFEFVPRDIDNALPGTYTLEAVTPDLKITSVEGAVRLPGRVHLVNLVFLGRGSAEGTVRYDNGQAVPNARVVVGSTMFDQFRTTTTDASGRYAVGDLPVGPLTFSATDEDGNVTFAASEIRTPGQLLVQDLSIFRRPFPGTGTIRGIVRRSDTGAAVPFAQVGVYSQGYGLMDGFADASGRFEFRKVPVGFITVLAAEWTLSRISTAIDFDLNANEVRDVTLTLDVKPAEALVVIEGDVLRENPLFPGDTSKYERVAGAVVKLEKGQAVTADANGHYVFSSVPVSFVNKKITAYDPLTRRSVTNTIQSLDPSKVNVIPMFIATADGYGTGTIRVRVLDAAGYPVTGLRVIEPAYPPFVPKELVPKPGGIYLLENVPVGGNTKIWAISAGGQYGDQAVSGTTRVEFNGHVASLNLRLPGQGTVRVKLAADIDVIGDVKIVYPAWEEADMDLAPKEILRSTSENGVAGYASFAGIPALHDFTVSSTHPTYGYAATTAKVGFDGDVRSLTLQLNKLSTVRGVVYAIDGRTPVPGAAVRIEDGRQNQGIQTTLPDGSFEFRNVPAGVSFRVIAEVTQDGTYRTGVAAGNTPGTGGPVAGVSVVLRTQGSIEGRIVYAGFKVFDPQNPANNVVDPTPNDLSDNAPVPLANFSLRELDFPYRNFGTLNDPISADVLGRFNINNVFTGPLRITAVDPGNQENRGTWTGAINQEGERITALIGIGAEGFGPVTVRVLDPNAQNAPVPNAEVTLSKATHPFSRFDLSSTDSSGTVRFEQVPVGSYKVTAYSKALGKSGGSAAFNVANITGASLDVVLEFSGRVDGTLTDPENANRGVPGAPVTLTEDRYETRASTDVNGAFVFQGVREGTFRLEAKDTLGNRRAMATRTLTQIDPNPVVNLQLEPTETLHLSVYLPDDSGGNSNVLAPLVNLEVKQRNGDFHRVLQGSSFQMPGLLENEKYSISIKELGGDQRVINTSNSFPVGSAASPLKLVLPAYGSVEVKVTQGTSPAANAKVTVSGSSRSVTAYTDSTGTAVANGIPLGAVSVQVTTVDGAFSGSANGTLASQSTPLVVPVTLGAYAGLTGLVDAETGGPSVGTRVTAQWGSRRLEGFTDGSGRFSFQGITTGTTVTLTYLGPDDVTVGARQSVAIGAGDASKIVEAPKVRLDATPPQVVSFFPADNASNVSPDSSVRITFSERIQAAYVNSGHIQLFPADSATPVATSYGSVVNANGTFTVTLTPPAPPAGQNFPLKSNTLYRVVVSAEVRDLTGNRIPAARGASFITSDYAEPKVLKVVPAPTTAIQANTTFEFRFNEPIDPAPWQNGGASLRFYKISQHGENGTVLAEKLGRAYVDPTTGLSLFFAPNEPIEQESYYRIVFSGVRDLQGNVLATQTYHFFSYDQVQPFVTLLSPVPEGFPLISGVEYTPGIELRNGSATGAPAVDVAKVDYFRVDGATQTYAFTAKAAPWTYRFVAPDAPASGGTFTLRAIATDHSGNESAPADFVWQLRPNAAPQNVAVALTPSTSVYPGNAVAAAVTFEDEGTQVTVQMEAAAVQTDGSEYKASQVKTITRAKVSDPWLQAAFSFDLPATLKQGTRATFTATVTDMRGLKGTGSAGIDLTADAIAPEITSLSPPPRSRYNIGQKFQIAATVKDLETGVASVTFAFDNQTITVRRPDARAIALGNGTWSFNSGDITVPAKNVDTTIFITVTARDYNDNVTSKSTEVVYAGVNDPTVPKGAWLCPVEKAAYPAGKSLPVRLQVRATDDIAVTAVKFTIPGVAEPVAATRVGTTSTYETTATLTFPAAGEGLTVTATISDADPTHDVALPLLLEAVAVDVEIDNFAKAVTANDAADFTNKSVLVRGNLGKLVPHVPLTLKNLIILDGAVVETLPTTTTTERRLDLTVSGRLYIDCASRVDVTALGYLGGWGANYDSSGTNNDVRGRTVGNTVTGGATASSSASHGGLGGFDSSGVPNDVYGSITDPADLGSGGGGATSSTAGAAGGGALRLQGGVFAVAGAIRADGGSRFGSGHAGAGGSVNVRAAQLLVGPAARITANGGDDDALDNASRGGGGGRIAVYATDRLDLETLGLQLQARGGRNGNENDSTNRLSGGAGTVFIRRPGQALGELFAGALDERYPASNQLMRPTPLRGAADAPAAPLRFDKVTLGKRALVRADVPLEINGVVNDKLAATVDPTAVLILNAEVPAVQVTTTPAAGASLVQAGTLAVTYSATSVAGIGSVRLAFSPIATDRVDAYVAYPATAAPAAVNLTVPADAAPGNAALTLTVTDRAGRTFQTAPLAYTIVANAAPVIDAFEATPASIYPGKSVTATVTAHDDLKITRLTLTKTIGAGAPTTSVVTPNAQTVTNQIFSVPVDINTPGGQTMTLEIAAEDGYPGRAATKETRLVSILKDVAAPAVTLIAPLENALFNEGTGNTIQVRATISDAEVGVKEAFVQIGTGAPVALTKSSSEYVASVPVPNVEGTETVTRTLTVTGKDYEGNAATQSVTIRIQPINDVNAPVVSWSCPTSGATFPAGVSTRLLVYALGNNAGNAANGIQKVELFVGDSVTALPATAVAGQPNLYEASYAIPADAAANSAISIRAVATNASGLTETATTTLTIVVPDRTITTDTTISATDGSYDNKIVVVAGGTTTIAGEHTFTRLIVLGGGKVTHPATDATTIHRLTVSATAGIFVACDGSIDVSARGFTGSVSGYGRTWPNTTTGGSYNGAGGSHGGRGGAHDSLGDSAATYGSIHDPNTPGGSGGYYSNGTCNPCNSGGGVARLSAPTVIVDGKVLSNGQTTNGSGAGGSIRIDAGTLAGGGEIRAEGAPTHWAGGGGGRIALHYQSFAMDRGRITAAGGLHSGNPGRTATAGTVYLRQIDAGGAKLADELLMGNLDRESSRPSPLAALGSGTVTAVSGAAVTLSSLVPEWVEGSSIEFLDPAGAVLSAYEIVTRTANVVTVKLATAESAPNVSAGNGYRGLWRFDAVTLQGRGAVEADALRTPRIDGAANTLARLGELRGTAVVLRGGRTEVNRLLAAGSVTLQNAAVLTHSPTTASTIQRLTVDVTGALTVDATSSIDVSALGFTGSAAGYGRTWQNTNAGGSYNGAGGSHGGRGGAHDAHGDSAATYGSAVDPSTPGGAGGYYSNNTCSPCSSGGGVARIKAGTFLLDGKVLANGQMTSGRGAGAGGSIRIDAATISGAGEIHADGAPTYWAAGGGGRVALYYQSLGLDPLKITAAGGLHTGNTIRTGSAGTVYLRKTDASGARVSDELVVDNLDRPAQRPTTLPVIGSGTVTAVSGAVVTLSNPVPEWIEGATIEFLDAAGALLSSYEIESRTGTTVTLRLAAGQTANVSAGNGYRGLWPFTQVTARRQGTLDMGAVRTPLITTAGTSFVRFEELRGDDLVLRGLVEASRVVARSLALQNGAILSHPATTATTIHSLNVDVDGPVTIDATSAIDVSGRGFSGSTSGYGRTWPNTTTGGSYNGAGGSHGGRGGAHDSLGDSALTYGSVVDPNTPGGAGGYYSNNTCNPCSAGGGIARIKARAFTLDGKVLSNGEMTNGRGSGAGGSIRIDAETLGGTGEIRADGAPTYWAAGGGGRVAVYSQSLQLDPLKITAAGGLHAGNAIRMGAAGTVYLRRVDAGGAEVSDEAIADNVDRVASRTTVIPAIGTGTVTAVNGAVVTLSGPVPEWVEGAVIEFLDAAGAVVSSYDVIARTASTVTVRLAAGQTAAGAAAGSGYRGAWPFSQVTARRQGTIESDGLRGVSLITTTSTGLVRFGDIRNGQIAIRGRVEANKVVATSLAVQNGGALMHPSTTAARTHDLSIEGDTLTVDATSSIDVSGRGFSGSTNGYGRTWPNTGNGSYNGAGGSHGGRGGAHDTLGDSAATYGSVFDPNTPGGSGGYYSNNTCDPCSAGGGIARIKVRSFTLDGKVLSNGEMTNGRGSGAGGSIRIDAETLTGAGEIHADGAPTYWAAGGGGRVAVYYQTLGLDRAKITAAGGLHSGNTTRTGGAGTVFLKQAAQPSGDLIVDNAGRPTTRLTPLPSVGYRTVAEAGADFVRDTGAQFLGPDHLRGVRAFVNHDRTKSWPVVSNDGRTLRLDVTGQPFAAQSGQSLRGMYRLDSLKLRNARLDVVDALDLAAAVDKDSASTIIGANAGPPLLNLSAIALQSTASGASVLGTAGAVTDLDPVTLTATNTATGNNYNAQANADGSFTIPVEGSAGQTFTLKAVDGNAYPLSSPVVTIGTLESDTPAPSQINKTAWTTDTNFVPRILSRDGDYLAISSYPATNGASTSLIVLGVADPAHPNLLRAFTSTGGNVRDVVVRDGWAHFAANRLYTLNLADPAATAVTPSGSDAPGAEQALALSGGMAYTSEVDWYNDGRLQVHDVSSPSQPRVFNGLQPTGEGVVYTAILAPGTDYLYAISPNKSSSVGRDVVVIDRRDPFSLRKVFSLDIPSFDAFGGAVSGTKLYLISRSTASLAVVDIANPAAPAVLATLALPAAANAVTIVGNDAFIAGGSAGLITADVSNPAAPRVTGTTPVNGVAWDVEIIGGYAYVANELGIGIVPVQTGPRVDLSKISLAVNATSVTVTGTAQAVVGSAPVTVEVTNSTTGHNGSAPVQSNGSFTVTLPGLPGQSLALKATDSAGRVAGPYSIGSVTFGAQTKQTLITPSMKLSDTAFFARNVSSDGNWAAVTSWEWPSNWGGSNKVLIFDVTQRANPVWQRTIQATGDARDVVVKNGWAYIAANRLYTLNLSDPSSTPIAPSGSDAAGAEQAIEISGGFAFTAEVTWYNDGRIQVYDVSNPAAPRTFNGLQPTGTGVPFTALTSFGTDYLIGVAPYKTGTTGHDVVVIDRRDPYALKKIADFDVPNFDALRGKVVGTRIILAGTTGGVATVDLSNPKAPQLVGITATPGSPRGVDAYGTVLAVGDGSSGVTFGDLSSGGVPALTGTQPIGGAAWEVAFNGTALYAVNDSSLVAIDGLGTAPLVDTSAISMSTSGSMVTVAGAANAIRGVGALTIEVKNTRTQASIGGIAVQSNGSFSVLIPAAAGDPMTVKATDSVGRSSGPLSIGTVPFGSQSAQTVMTPSMKLSDANFYSRNVASHGNWAVVTSFEWPGSFGGSNKVAIFDATDRANPVWQRTIQATGDARDVVVRDGWAYIAANRLYTLNLNDPASTPIAPAGSDWAGAEQAIEISGGLAFTAEVTWYNDGRIQVYDVSTPSAPRVLGSQQSTGTGVLFTSLTALGNDYLVASSPYKTGTTGHDVVVLDRRDPYSIKRVADYDIPNFDGFRGKVVGGRLYLAGMSGGLAVVDVSTPTAPQLVGIVQTPGSPRGVDALGAILAVSDGTAGVTFLDTSGTGLPVILGTQPAGGAAWESSFNGATLYVANEIGLTTIHDLGTAPLIDRNLIVASSDGVSVATATGSAKSVLGIAPVTLELRNAHTGASSSVTVAPDGSFTAGVAGTSGQPLTVKATDSLGRAAGPVFIGFIPFGSATTSITITAGMSDSSFLARNVSADGNDLVVGGTEASNKILHFDVSSAGTPVYKRTVATNNGGVRDVVVRDGWAYIGADRLVTLNLANPAATPNVPSGDMAGGDAAVVLSGGYAFTAEVAWYNDGRINVYDVSSPATPKLLGQHGTGSGVSFTGLTSLGHDYLIGISPFKTNSTIGHDVVVIDRRDVFKLRKIADFDIPNFDGVHGRVLDNRLYVAGTSGGVAIVDLSNPAAPVHVTTLTAPAAARMIDIAGSTLAVANGSNGISFVDVTAPAAPAVLGAHATPGHAWEVALSRGAMYVANETGVTAVARAAVPPMLNESLLTIAPAATETTVAGAAQALTGITPITVRAVNDATGAAGTAAAVNADGSFSVAVAATPGQPLSLKATDAAGRVSVRKLGSTFGVTTTHAANQSVASIEANYNARRLATDGSFTFASSGSTYATPLNTSSNLLLFRPGTATTVVPFSGGAVSDVEISGGFAFFAGDRLGTIQLSDPTFTTRLPAANNVGVDIALALIGNYAVTAEAGWYNDGRLNVYNVTNPAAPVTMRQQRLAVASTVYRSLVPIGTSYLVAISPDKPGGVGHDINVIDVTSIDNFVLKVDLDIAGIDAIDGVLDGATLYLTGIDGALAIVDMTNPLAPVVRSVTKLPGNSRGVAVSGTNEIVVADATSLTFVNVADQTAPVVIGRQKLAGNIADVRVAGKTIHVAAENHYHTIQRP